MVTAPGVLVNYTQIAAYELTACLVISRALFRSNLNSDGSFTYSPALNYNGPDSFTYKANDGQADSPTNATVSITVTPVNDPPGTSGGIVADDSYTTPEDTTLRAEEHTSELQSHSDLVCRLLPEQNNIPAH